MYIKDGKLSKCTHIELNGYVVYHPTIKQIHEAGWVEYVAPAPAPLTNDDIRLRRQAEYERRSDSLYMAYVKYVEQGKLDKAETAKANWLAEIELINQENPYIEEA